MASASKKSKYNKAVANIYLRTIWPKFVAYSALFTVNNNLEAEKGEKLNWSRMLCGAAGDTLFDNYIVYDLYGKRNEGYMYFGHGDLGISVVTLLKPAEGYIGKKEVEAELDQYGVPITESVKIKITGYQFYINIILEGASHTFDDLLRATLMSWLNNNYEPFELFDGNVDQKVASWMLWSALFKEDNP